MKAKILPGIAALFSILAVSSCSTTRLAVDITSDALKDGISAFYQEDDFDLARRGMEANLKLLEVFHNANPKNENLRILLAQAYGGFSFIFLETDMLYAKNSEEKNKLLKRITNFYTRGLNYGLSMLKEDVRLKTAMDKNDLEMFASAASSITKREALFWTVFNWALLINMNKSNVDQISDLPKVKILVDRMIDLDKKFFNAAPLALKATLECAMPKMLGGKPDLGVNLLEEALEIGKHNALITQFLYAQYCTPAVQNKKRFFELANEIEKADATTIPDATLINVAVKNKMPEIKRTVKNLFEE